MDKYQVERLLKNNFYIGTIQEIKHPCQTGYIDGKKEYEIVEAKVVHIEVTICKTQNGSVGIKGEDWYGSLNTYIRVEDKKDCQLHSMRGEKLYKTREEAESHITKK